MAHRDPELNLWDDELSELSVAATEIVGEDTVMGIVDRVTASFLGHSAEEDLVALGFACRAAIKAELRRLVTPH